MTVEEVMMLAPVIPVLVVHDAADARPIAEALVAGGLRALEVTLRTEAALDVIREMAKVEGAVVGAGTVLNPADVELLVAAQRRREDSYDDTLTPREQAILALFAEA